MTSAKGTRNRVRIRPGRCVLLAVAGCVLLANNGYGQAFRQGRKRVNPNAQRSAQPEKVERHQARLIIQHYLRDGLRQPYVGEQVTRLTQMGGRVRETRQTVKYGGPGRMRMEYSSPADLRGETILMTGGRFFHYRPAEKDILEGVAAPEEFLIRIQDVMRGVRDGTIQVNALGEELVAGHAASIAEIRSVSGGRFYLKFWIDQATGVRLKYESFDPQGRMISETYFTSVNFTPVFDNRDFTPASLPNVVHSPRLPDGPPLPNVQAAQQQVAFQIREPAVPAGFRQNGIWVVTFPAGRHTVILRYSDGVNTYALFENPANPKSAQANAPAPRNIRFRNGVAHWAAGGLNYALIGNLRPENVRLIEESLR